MSRYAFTLNTSADRARVMQVITAAPAGARVEVKAAKRSLEQNAKLWAALSDVALQKEHCGRKYTPNQWKVLFMHAAGREVQFIPSLDQSTFIPWGNSSSDLSKEEMSNLLEFIIAWGTQNGVTFHGDEVAA
jgi:hypothetical protein